VRLRERVRNVEKMVRIASDGGRPLSCLGFEPLTRAELPAMEARMRAPTSHTEASPRLLPLLGWLTAALFFFYAWVLRVAPSVMVEELMRDFAVGAAVLGNLSAVYFYGYAGMQIPVGLLLDRFGPRRLITISTLVCAGGCVLFAAGQTLGVATWGRFLIGASAAFSLVGSMAVAGQWFRADRFAMFSGLAMALGMAGGVFGQAPLRLAVEASDWRSTMLLLAAGGLGLSLAAWASIRDRWRGSGGPGGVLASLGIVARHRQTWLIALGGLATSGPLLGFASLWGVPYLETAYGLSRTHAATLTSLLFVGWGVGAPLFGWLSDRIGRRRSPILVGLTLQIMAQAALIYLPGLPTLALGSLCFLAGFLGSSQIVCFALARENHPAERSGTAIGFVNGMVTGAGAVYQPLIGFLLDLAWAGGLAQGARVYDVGAYRLALTSLVVLSIAGFLCLLAVRETFGKPLEARSGG
jgi:MFS family permease